MTITTLTVEQVKADVTIPRELIRQLDRLQAVDRTPLGKWARESFTVGRRIRSAEGKRIIDDERIADCVIAWAEDREYSQPHISIILRENGFYRYNKERNLETKFTPKNYITTFKGIVRGLSGLKEIEIMAVSSQRELENKADGTLNRHVARMGESELREYPKHIKNLKTLLNAMESKIEQKKKRAETDGLAYVLQI